MNMNMYVSGSGNCVEGVRKSRMKCEEKQMNPMFPRLHINDAEKGGPRPPPRNKMALYEQLSTTTTTTTHSPKSTSASVSMSPLPNNNSSTILVPLTSSSHDGTHRSVFPSFCNSSGFTHPYETLHSYHSGGLNLNATLTTLEQHPKEHTSYQTSNAMWHLNPTAECKLFRPHSFPNFKNSSVKKLGDKDDYRVPTSARSPMTPNFGNDQHNTHKAKITSSSLNASGQWVTAFEKQRKQTGTTDLKSRQHQILDNTQVSHTSPDCAKKPAPMMSSGDRTVADTSSSLRARGRNSEPVDHALVSLNPKKRSSLVDYITRLGDPNIKSHQEYSILKENKALTDGAFAEPKSAARKRSASTMEDMSDAMPSQEDNRRRVNRLEAVHECCEVIDSGAPQVGKVDRNGEISKLQVMDSTPGLDISPDGVVGVMGQKQFWNTRSTIVLQQRVFAVQVFELHRLIKVQRLIAGSPELMLEGSFCLGKPSRKLSLVKLPYENVLEQPPLIPKPKIDYEIPMPSNDCAAESAVTKIPLPSLRNDTNKRLARQSDDNLYTGILPPASTATDAKSDNKPCSGTTQPAFAATKANLAPLCFHSPPGNQWLVAVKSPSEGLVYKPYTGFCPPNAGLVGPVYGSCGPMALTPVTGDFFTPTYGGILSGTPLGQTYFAPYGVPVMNPSGLGIDQIVAFARAESIGTDNQLPIPEVNFTIPYQSSCNMLRHKSGVISGCPKKLQASRESDLQGSTASSPTARTRGHALPLFPIAPAVQVPDQPAKSHSTEKQIGVIKVVPHNPKSASESAARIFQSIQEERRVHD